jgi:hypothetical protein
MFALLAGALVVLLILIQIRVLRFAYMQLGVKSGTAFFLLLGSLLGSTQKGEDQTKRPIAPQAPVWCS